MDDAAAHDVAPALTTEADLQSVYKAALFYAGIGWSILPLHGVRSNGSCTCGNLQCGAVGKHPCTSHGLNDATINPATISEWWKQWPWANIGIATGPSRLDVIDVDLKSGGPQSLAALEEKLGALPKTLCAQTGGGGNHYVLRCEGDGIRTRVTAFGSSYPGIDTRGVGGYIVAPPSLHRSGRRYAWDASYPDEPTTLPPVWREALQTAQEAKQSEPFKLPERICGGERNDTLFRAGCALRDKGFSEGAIRAALSKENVERCEPPLDESEVATIAASAARYEPKNDIFQDEILTTIAGSDDEPTFVRVGDLLSESDTEAPLLVDGLLGCGTTAFVVSKPKVGKSVFLTNLALSVARGTPFLGLTTQRGVVLYLAMEGGRAAWCTRLRAMGASADDNNLLFCIGRTPQNALRWLQRETETHKPALIIIDTFQHFAKLKDLNDYAAVTNASGPFIALAASSGATLVFAHHSKKNDYGDDGDSVLGSTGLFGFVDTLITLKKHADGGRTMTTKQRDGADKDATVLALDSESKTLSVSGSRANVSEDACALHILAVLSDEWVNEPTALDGIPARLETKRAALRKLVDEGRVARKGRGTKGKPHVYARFMEAFEEAWNDGEVRSFEEAREYLGILDKETYWAFKNAQNARDTHDLAWVIEA